MASITSQKSGGYRAQVCVVGALPPRDSKTFSTRGEAKAWAAQRETEMRKNASQGINADHTFSEAIDRYVEQVSVHKKGARWEAIRLNAIANEVVNAARLGDLKLCAVTAKLLGEWRDTRLKVVKSATVNRDFSLLSNLFSVAKKEWKWIAESPTSDVRRPLCAPPRERRVHSHEIDALCQVLNFNGEMATTKRQAVAIAFLFAIETGMRAGEICGLTYDDVQGNVAHLPRTKNGTKRAVPLSERAKQLLALLPKNSTLYFGLASASLDALFRKAKKAAMIKDLTFHDSRHEAITRLARKLGVLDLARMVGHRDLRMLQVYYNESAEDIAKKL
ncbi:MAG: site-specific integrase [Pseudomonadota bacterium]